MHRNMLPPGRFVSSPRNFISGETVITRAVAGNERSIDNVDSFGNANGTETIM